MDNDLKLDGLSILVTGSTESFGQAFVRTVLERYAVRRIIVFSRDEAKQHEMSLVLRILRYPALRYFVWDVRDAPDRRTSYDRRFQRYEQQQRRMARRRSVLRIAVGAPSLRGAE